ncbi:protein kinase [Moorena sp. SIO3B2]|uniref:protein kinase domain-containing protein n=1 Tax=Moorena sp. SIO3B2 TaxID=2607827 RepID=UPI0013C69778|nr:protein kinase [Moorena sp. SIO3B2]NEP32917.1 protein kinase [Moorena sp. SIO3B2]
MLGKLLDGRYQVTQVLGSGGFGKTYLAKDTKRPGNPSCVVKQLQPPNGSQTFLETARRLFSREAETLEKLGNHDQIPRLLAYFEEDHEFYLVQQFIEGHLLSQELSPGHRWQEKQVIALLQEVLGILEFVHRHGVIHRDIKPDNLIRRTADQKLVLVDFGAVKQVQTDLVSAYRQTHHTVVVGTPGYMSSEQALGQPCPSSDIYALGIIGIQALTGMLPDQFQEDLKTGEVNWQSLVSVSLGLANVLTKMVRYQVKDRYQSASQVLRDLQKLTSNSKPYSINSPTYYSIHNIPTVEENFPPEQLSKPFSEQKTWDANADRGSTPNKPAPTPLPPTKADRSDNLSLIIGTGIALVTSSIAGMIYSMRSSSWSPPKIVKPIAPRSTPNHRSDPVVYEPPAPAAPGNCQVTGNPFANVRSEPNGSKVGQLNQGTSLVLTGSGQPGWVEISSPVTGWVFTNLTDCAPTVDPVVATAPKRNVPKRNVPKQKVYPKPKPVVRRAPSPPQTRQPIPAQPVDNGSLILARAVDKYQAGNIKGAIAIAQDVLPSSSAFNGAQTKIDQWHNEWISFERKFDQIQQAYEQGRWVDVLNYAQNSNLPARGHWRQKLNRIMAQARQQQAALEAKRKQLAVQNQIGSRANQRIQNNSQPASRPVSIAAPLPKQPVVTRNKTTAAPPSQSTKIKYYVILNDGSASGLAKARKIVPGAFLGRFPQGTRIQMGAFKNEAKANAFANQLRQQGMSASIYIP